MVTVTMGLLLLTLILMHRPEHFAHAEPITKPSQSHHKAEAKPGESLGAVYDIGTLITTAIEVAAVASAANSFANGDILGGVTSLGEAGAGFVDPAGEFANLPEAVATSQAIQSLEGAMNGNPMSLLGLLGPVAGASGLNAGDLGIPPEVAKAAMDAGSVGQAIYGISQGNPFAAAGLLGPVADVYNYEASGANAGGGFTNPNALGPQFQQALGEKLGIMPAASGDQIQVAPGFGAAYSQFATDINKLFPEQTGQTPTVKAYGTAGEQLAGLTPNPNDTLLENVLFGNLSFPGYKAAEQYLTGLTDTGFTDPATGGQYSLTNDFNAAAGDPTRPVNAADKYEFLGLPSKVGGITAQGMPNTSQPGLANLTGQQLAAKYGINSPQWVEAAVADYIANVDPNLLNTNRLSTGSLAASGINPTPTTYPGAANEKFPELKTVLGSSTFDYDIIYDPYTRAFMPKALFDQLTGDLGKLTTDVSIKGVTDPTANALVDIGFAGDPAIQTAKQFGLQDVKDLMAQGMTPDQITYLATKGYSASSLKLLENQGYTPSMIGQLSSLGYSPDALVGYAKENLTPTANQSDIANQVAKGGKAAFGLAEFIDYLTKGDKTQQQAKYANFLQSTGQNVQSSVPAAGVGGSASLPPPSDVTGASSQGSEFPLSFKERDAGLTPESVSTQAQRQNVAQIGSTGAIERAMNTLAGITGNRQGIQTGAPGPSLGGSSIPGVPKMRGVVESDQREAEYG